MNIYINAQRQTEVTIMLIKNPTTCLLHQSPSLAQGNQYGRTEISKCVSMYPSIYITSRQF